MGALTVDVGGDAISGCCINVLTTHSDLARKVAGRRGRAEWTTQKGAAKTFVV